MLAYAQWPSEDMYTGNKCFYSKHNGGSRYIIPGFPLKWSFEWRRFCLFSNSVESFNACGGFQPGSAGILGIMGILNLATEVEFLGWPLCFYPTQDPHQHRLSVDVIPELRNAENYCRNPGGESDRPWCYTTNPNVRWEYCLVPKCGEGI